jgi:hypothetical protein
MALPSNPQTLANYDITKSDQAKIFVKKVSDLFQALSTAIGLTGILNGSGFLQTSSLQIKSVELGAVSTNQTVECLGATSVAVHFTSAVAVTLTLAHLALGVPVMIWFGNTSGGAVTIFVAATQPGGTAYTGVFWKSSTALTNMTSTGLSIAGGAQAISSGSSAPIPPNWDLGMVVN